MSQKISSSQFSDQTLRTLTLNIVEMNSVKDMTYIKTQLLKQAAISQVNMTLRTNSAQIIYDLATTNSNQIIQIVQALGYSVKQQSLAIDEHNQKHNHNHIFMPSKSSFTLFFIALLFIIQNMGHFFGFDAYWLLGLTTQWLLATFVQFFLGFYLYKKLYTSIKIGVNNTDILLILATQSIWIYSTLVYLSTMGYVNLMVASLTSYFDVCVIILAITTIGKLVQNKIKSYNLSGAHLTSIYLPKWVECHNDGDNIEVIESDKLKISDLIHLKEGDRVAGDGIVCRGIGWFNQAHLTGESQLVQKIQGDSVLAGSLLENGELTYQVRKLGKHTIFGSMIYGITQAQKSKVPISRVIDGIVNIFVPVVLIISSLTLLYSYYLHHDLNSAILQAIAVLVVASPATFWLATSESIVAGTGIASRCGVWFNDAQSLQKVSNVDTVIFNKTATLTTGEYKLASHYFLDASIKLSDVLQLAASVEQTVDHPIAKAIRYAAQQQKISLLPIKNIISYQNQGVEAFVENMGIVKVGSAHWLDMELPTAIQKNLPTPFKSATLIAVTINDIPLGFLVLIDEIRADAQELITHLQREGIETIIMSSDCLASVSHTADKLGVVEYASNTTPQTKVQQIKDMKANGRVVAMVGNGMNDIPIMAHADVCFDMSKHSPKVEGITFNSKKYSATAVLLGSSLIQVYTAKKIATVTVKIMKQNLLFAAAYHVVALLLAVFGYVTPIIAVLLMILSGLVVLINIRRLNYFKLEFSLPKTKSNQ